MKDRKGSIPVIVRAGAKRRNIPPRDRTNAVVASDANQAPKRGGVDGFVAALLAMTFPPVTAER
jgi:hypothetical protein